MDARAPARSGSSSRRARQAPVAREVDAGRRHAHRVGPAPTRRSRSTTSRGARRKGGAMAAEVRLRSALDRPSETVEDVPRNAGSTIARAASAAPATTEAGCATASCRPLGRLDARTFTRDDVELAPRRARHEDSLKASFRGRRPRTSGPLVTSMCDDMENAKKRELRVREDNPCSDVKPPERGAASRSSTSTRASSCRSSRARSAPPLASRPWRWPSTRTPATPSSRARVGRCDSTSSTARSITRAFNRKTKKVKATKTGRRRRFAIEPSAAAAPGHARDEKGEGEPAVVAPAERAGHGAQPPPLALSVANVRRAELHKGAPTRKPMTWHDLRATGITWMAVRGDDPLKSSSGAGTPTSATTEIYIREAEAVREGFGDVFPPAARGSLESPRYRPGGSSCTIEA